MNPLFGRLLIALGVQKGGQHDGTVVSYWWQWIYKQPCYKDVPAYVNGVSEAIFKVGMCLPAGPYVSDEDVKYIVETIKNAIEK